MRRSRRNLPPSVLPTRERALASLSWESARANETSMQPLSSFIPSMVSLDATTSPASESRVSPAEAPLGARLRVVWSCDPAGIGRVVTLGGELLRIGREQHDTGLCLNDARLSRVHARVGFDRQSGAVRIGDAQSRNGTFVNGRRIETALLVSGDVIRAGDTLLVYEHGDVMAAVDAQAAAAAKLSATALIRGETGTGKELLARKLHRDSGRSGPFVALNCATVPLELLSAELFGHTKTAFSGAAQARKGVFLEAAGGTLLLDEIGDCPMPIQAALLRALQERAIRPVGAEREVAVDVRVVAATHCDLEAAIAAGTFRADLYARLAQVVLALPPLRERRADILTLLATFLKAEGHACVLTGDAAEALLTWSWPLNIRELQSLALACTVRGFLPGTLGLDQLREAAPSIATAQLERRAASGGQDTPPRPSTGPAVHQQLRSLLETHGGNVSAVADELGKPRAQVYRWLRAMGVSPNRFRK